MIRRILGSRPKQGSQWTSIIERGMPPRLDTASGKRVLCATSVGDGSLTRAVDSLVAVAAWLRGADVDFLLCDGALQACEVCSFNAFPDVSEFTENGPQARLCGACFSAGEADYAALPIPVHRYRAFVSQSEIDAALQEVGDWSVEHCFTFTEADLHLGEQARAGTLRFFGKASLETEPVELVAATSRRYAAAAKLTAVVCARVLDHLRPDVVVAHHGVYVPQGILGEVARRNGVRLANWGASYRNTTVIFSHNDTYHHTFISEPTDTWDRGPLDAADEEALLAYLAERRHGRGDWTWVTSEAALRPSMQERDELIDELGLDESLPTFGLLTNVAWDAQLYYQGHAFENMFEWLWATIDHFVAHPELQLVVRVHPHEVKAGNRQSVTDEIVARYTTLPSNIKLIAHDHPFNTYALMSLCQAVLIYGTKTGVELAPLGMPVIVAGDAWIRDKSLTIDVETRKHYADILDRITDIERLDADTVARARAYGFHYFFRRMIPISSLEPEGEPRVGVASIADLLPGNDPGLDVIVEGVLDGTPFIFNGN